MQSKGLKRACSMNRGAYSVRSRRRDLRRRKKVDMAECKRLNGAAVNSGALKRMYQCAVSQLKAPLQAHMLQIRSWIVKYHGANA
jgi:hypothetical protein